MNHIDTQAPNTTASRSPRSLRWIAAAGALLAAAVAMAGVETKGLTGGLESGTEFVTLPSSPRGSLSVRECSDCPSMRLEFDSQTKFFVGEEAVSYAELRKAASKGDRGLLVSYRLGTRKLTGLRLSAAGNGK
jgi:hypothetical protein